jgi:hypothetical protein
MIRSPHGSAAASSGMQGGFSGWAKSFLKGIWFVPALAVLVVILFVVFEHTRLSDVGHKFFAALIYSAFIGIPCSLVLNWIGRQYANRYPRLMVWMNVVGTAGDGYLRVPLAGGLVFQVHGHDSPSYLYWAEFSGVVSDHDPG